MAWNIGVDEAGYGPNLGPFVMTAVACRLPDEHRGADLWQLLAAAVRKAGLGRDSRLVIDDSKAVYSPARGLAALERGVLACLGTAGTLGDLASRHYPKCVADLRTEPWYLGAASLPVAVTEDDLAAATARFTGACAEAGHLAWQARGAIVCPPRFNAVAEAAASKGAVLTESLGRLLSWAVPELPGDDALAFHIDKHGGRNNYAAGLQHALPGGSVIARQEGAARSVYEVVGLRRPVSVTFEPRADQAHFCVALASMASKYTRELLMGEFNAFWATHVPGLKPTAGYPTDAHRFLAAILPAIQRLGMREEAVWRQR